MSTAQLTPAGLAWAAVEEHRAQQDPGELAQVAELIAGEQVGRVLEIGIRFGGSMWLWRNLFPDAELYAIDLIVPPCDGCDRRRAHSGCPRLHFGSTDATLTLGDSTKSETRDAMLELVAERSRLPMREGRTPFGLVHIDGDHDEWAVRADFELYGPLVRPGGFVVFHDAVHCEGVAVVVHELMAAHPDDTWLFEGDKGGQGTGVLRVPA